MDGTEGVRGPRRWAGGGGGGGGATYVFRVSVCSRRSALRSQTSALGRAHTGTLRTWGPKVRGPG